MTQTRGPLQFLACHLTFLAGSFSISCWTLRDKGWYLPQLALLQSLTFRSLNLISPWNRILLARMCISRILVCLLLLHKMWGSMTSSSRKDLTWFLMLFSSNCKARVQVLHRVFACLRYYLPRATHSFWSISEQHYLSSVHRFNLASNLINHIPLMMSSHKALWISTFSDRAR